MIFLDTDISIDILKGKLEFDAIANDHPKSKFATTSPTVFELYNGIYKLKFTKKRISKEKIRILLLGMNNLLNNLHLFNLDINSAERAARIYNKLVGKGETINPFDCLIAAIILENSYNSILTRNVAHFEKIEGLHIVKVLNS